MLARRTSLVIAASDIVTAALVVFGIFVALPARWWPVDTAAAALTAMEVASGTALIVRAPRAVAVARAAGAAALALGLFTVTVLAVTASWLSGIYGPIGHGGAIVLALVAALVLPYLVILPIAKLLCLRPSIRSASSTSE